MEGAPRRPPIALALIAILALTALALWSSSDPFQAQPTTDPQPQPPTSNPLQPHTRTPTTTSRDAHPTPTPALTPSPTHITIRGRCVDASGTPLPDVHITLSGYWNTRSKSPGPHLPPPTTTTQDGTFLFRVEPRPNWAFKFHLTTPGRVPMVGIWSRLLRDTDLGDLILPAGVVVHGRVLDTKGTPRPGLHVRIPSSIPSPDSPDPLQPSDDLHGTTTADGTFRTPPLLPGPKRIYLRHEIVRSPTHITLPPTPAEHFIEILVENPDDWPSIQGLVVDDADRPVPGATIHTAPPVRGYDTQPTTATGAFTIMKPADGPPGPFRLRIRKPGFADLDTEQSLTWGTHDARLRLTRLPAIDLRVTGDTTHIEHFAVWITDAPGFRRTIHSRYERLRTAAHHPRGHASITDLPPGKLFLKVLPTDPQWLASDFVPVHLAPGPSPRLLVQLHRPAHRLLLVRWAGSDDPIEGANVELLEPLDESPITPRTHAADPGHPLSGSPAIRRQHTTTDHEGRARVSGPAARDLVLRISGNGFAPLIRSGVHLDAAGPLTIEVERPARVSGRIKPLLLVRQLRELAGTSSPIRPGVALRRGPPAQRERIPAGYSAATLDEDGRFEIAAVPAGSWEVMIRHVVAGQRGTTTGFLPVGHTVDLAQGEHRRLDLDLAHLVFATVDLTVRLDGAPLRGKSVYLDGEANKGVNLVTGADGRIRATVPPGRYTAQLFLDSLRIPAAGFLEILPGQHLERTVDVRTRSVTLRVTGTDGKRRAGVRLVVGQPPSRNSLDPTRADSDHTLRLTPGDWVVWALPKDSDTAWKHLVQVGKLTVRPGAAPQPAQIILPEALGY